MKFFKVPHEILKPLKTVFNALVCKKILGLRYYIKIRLSKVLNHFKPTSFICKIFLIKHFPTLSHLV